MTALIKANQVSKHYGAHCALSPVSFELHSGQVLGLLGHNGAGKSSLINALLGAHTYQGDISINGYHPIKQHKEVMGSLAYISDVNVLPHWMSVKQIIKYTSGVHHHFDKHKALSLLSRTHINLTSKIGSLSKGMKVQLHLALIIATDCNVLILDEPTLGLDLMYRDTFYRHLLDWLQDGERGLLIASHDIAEIEPLLTDVLILKNGQQKLSTSIEQINEQYFILEAEKQHQAHIHHFHPLTQSSTLGVTRWLLDTQCREHVEHLGRCYCASLTDIFKAFQQGSH